MAFAVAAVGAKMGSPGIVIGAIGWGSVVFYLHRIEVKLNRLLDPHRIIVGDNED